MLTVHNPMKIQFLILVIAAQVCAFHAQIWLSDEIPNPLVNPESCGFAVNTTACLCDPEMLIDPKDRSKLNSYCLTSEKIYIAVISDVLDANHDMQAFTQSVFDNWGLGTNLSSYNVLILATGVQHPNRKHSNFYIATSQLLPDNLLTKSTLTKENLKGILSDIKENDVQVVHSANAFMISHSLIKGDRFVGSVEDALTCGVVSTDMYLNGGHSHFPEEDNCIFSYESRERAPTHLGRVYSRTQRHSLLDIILFFYCVNGCWFDKFPQATGWWTIHAYSR